MKFKEFLAYLESNLDGYKVFMSKALAYQNEKNARRTGKNHWKDEKVRKAAYEMWRTSMENFYNQVKKEVNSDFPSAWVSFIEKNNLFEVLNDGIQEMDFSDDGAA